MMPHHAVLQMHITYLYTPGIGDALKAVKVKWVPEGSEIMGWENYAIDGKIIQKLTMFKESIMALKFFSWSMQVIGVYW